MTTISLCAIVKNEESLLPRALASWRALADELIVVDTGSTDDTVGVAQAFDAQVLHYDWQHPGNKGEARNAGLDAATGEWIVVQDADEIICDPAGIRHFLKNLPDDAITALNVQFENYAPEDGALTLRWLQVRIFRRGLYRYIHREHELPHWIGPSEQWPAPHEVILETTFAHRAPPGRAPAKMQPMLDRLTLDVAEHPGDPGPLYFLHRQYLLNGDYAAAIEAGKTYLACPALADPCECYGNLASCCYILGEGNEAIRWLHKAAAEQPDRRIWWVRMAEMYMAAGLWNIGLAHLRLAEALAPSYVWQREPVEEDAAVAALIDKCQHALGQGHDHGG